MTEYMSSIVSFKNSLVTRYSFYSTCIAKAVVDVAQCMKRLFMRVKYSRRLCFLLVILRRPLPGTRGLKKHSLRDAAAVLRFVIKCTKYYLKTTAVYMEMVYSSGSFVCFLCSSFGVCSDKNGRC